MNEWTQAARQLLDDCLNRNRRRFAAAGAEADEVAADLRRHLEFEAQEQQLKVVTESDVRRILARVAPELIEPSSLPSPPAEPPRGSQASSRPEPPAFGPTARVLLWVFSVVLPLAALVVEFFTRGCAFEFVDPLPTWIHVMLIATVPIANAAALLCLQRRNEAPPNWLWWLHAVSWGVAATYAALFLPVTPFAMMGILFFGIGFLPLAPLISLICGSILSVRLRRQAAYIGSTPPRRRWLAGLAAVAVILAPSVPLILTYHWLYEAVNGTDQEQVRAVQRLRQFGQKSEISSLAYGQFRGGLRQMGLSSPCTTEQAQELYFRVTGQPFNAVPPSVGLVRGAQQWRLDEFEWDNSLGGTAVAGQVSGLSLMTSRLDASANAAEGWGYTEWTWEFRNDHERSDREARAILQLPPGGVVSRVTLWVSGEEREAAFGARSVVRQAYQEVAVQKRRDPILVTTAGIDRVLVQCFPVPARGGLMKVRIGITAPLQAVTDDSRAFLWPRIAERNFAIRDQVQHHAWFESLSGVPEVRDGWQRDGAGGMAIHGTFPHKIGADTWSSIALHGVRDSEAVWALDDRSTPAAWVRQQLEKRTAPHTGRLAFVIDAGKGAETWVRAVQQSLAAQVGRGRVGVWMAYDGAHRLDSGEGAEFPVAAKAIGSWNRAFEGGHDPSTALSAALDWIGESGEGTVVWIHGAQPGIGGHGAAVTQRIDRMGSRVQLVDVPAVEGPNALLNDLEGTEGVRSWARIGTLESDLGRFLEQWCGLTPTYRWNVERVSTPPATGAKGSRHLVRLWAADRVQSLAATRHRDEASALASQWQLVTRVSGAVVLETKAQFEQHGLTAVDPLTTPTVVPEPQTWALLVVGLGALAIWGRRRRRSSSR